MMRAVFIVSKYCKGVESVSRESRKQNRATGCRRDVGWHQSSRKLSHLSANQRSFEGVSGGPLLRINDCTAPQTSDHHSATTRPFTLPHTSFEAAAYPPHSQRPPIRTAIMPEIEMPDAEELGGNVTKPFKFVTGTKYPAALSAKAATYPVYIY
jgi:hypothetical protein